MKILTEGVGPVERLDETERHDYVVAQFSQAARLIDLEEEYAFFTHAPLFTHGNWNKDPVLEFIADNHGAVVHRLFMRLPIFKGLRYQLPHGKVIDDWNHILLAAHKDCWADLYDHMRQSGAADRERRIYQRMLIQQFPIADPVVLDKATVIPSPCPMVEIMTFSLDGSDRIVAFEPAMNPPLDRVSIKILAPDPQVQQVAARNFNNDPTPLRSLEPSDPASRAEMSRLQKRGLKQFHELRKKGAFDED